MPICPACARPVRLPAPTLAVAPTLDPQSDDRSLLTRWFALWAVNARRDEQALQAALALATSGSTSAKQGRAKRGSSSVAAPPALQLLPGWDLGLDALRCDGEPSLSHMQTASALVRQALVGLLDGLALQAPRSPTHPHAPLPSSAPQVQVSEELASVLGALRRALPPTRDAWSAVANSLRVRRRLRCPRAQGLVLA